MTKNCPTPAGPPVPPPELVRRWMRNGHMDIAPLHLAQTLATQAAAWGADQELEACCEWLKQETPEPYINALRDARRPKLPSLKQQALAAIATSGMGANHAAIIRRALEALPD